MGTASVIMEQEESNADEEEIAVNSESKHSDMEPVASLHSAINRKKGSSAKGKHTTSTGTGRYVNCRRKSLFKTALPNAAIGLVVLAFVVSYAIIGGLTGFKSRSSKSPQCGWTIV